MQLPKFFQGESLTRLAQGAAFGAVATMIIGFNWGGWVLGKTAETNATTLVNAALVQAYGPVCIEDLSISPTWRRSGLSSRRSIRGAARATSRKAASRHLQARHRRSPQSLMRVQTRSAK